MNAKECPYNRGNGIISRSLVRDQENCPELDCSDRGRFFKCYLENCRTEKEEVVAAYDSSRV